MISQAKGDSLSGSLNGTIISLTVETKSPGQDVGLGIPPCKQRIYSTRNTIANNVFLQMKFVLYHRLLLQVVIHQKLN